ncbi:hypothetical protein TWF481_010990 [Arthrobotrys musiformis]|uniref:Uncharacterized protein n=1 Tax=Arthrobotrys musiformis TaxID=47236 RepID=A0AAV9W332_9PEZI
MNRARQCYEDEGRTEGPRRRHPSYSGPLCQNIFSDRDHGHLSASPTNIDTQSNSSLGQLCRYQHLGNTSYCGNTLSQGYDSEWPACYESLHFKGVLSTPSQFHQPGLLQPRPDQYTLSHGEDGPNSYQIPGNRLDSTSYIDSGPLFDTYSPRNTQQTRQTTNAEQTGWTSEPRQTYADFSTYPPQSSDRPFDSLGAILDGNIPDYSPSRDDEHLAQRPGLEKYPHSGFAAPNRTYEPPLALELQPSPTQIRTVGSWPYEQPEALNMVTAPDNYRYPSESDPADEQPLEIAAQILIKDEFYGNIHVRWARKLAGSRGQTAGLHAVGSDTNPEYLVRKYQYCGRCLFPGCTNVSWSVYPRKPRDNLFQSHQKKHHPKWLVNTPKEERCKVYTFYTEELETFPHLAQCAEL